MLQILLHPQEGFLVVLLLVSLLPIMGGFFAYFVFPKIKTPGKEKLFQQFAAILMILLSLYLVAIQLLNLQFTNLPLLKIFPGFLIGLTITWILMIIADLINGKSRSEKLQHSHLKLGIILFLMLAIHEVLEGMSIADIFGDFGPGKFPLLTSFFSVSLLAIHEFPEGVLLTLPFFIIKKYKRGFLAVAVNQIIFLSSGLIFYFYLLRYFSLSIFEKAYMSLVPAGGIFLLGLHELIMANHIKTKKISAYGKVALYSVTVLIILTALFSLYITNRHILEKKEVRISGYEVNKETGKLRQVIYADPCEHNFELEGCLGD